MSSPSLQLFFSAGLATQEHLLSQRDILAKIFKFSKSSQTWAAFVSQIKTGGKKNRCRWWLEGEAGNKLCFKTNMPFFVLNSQPTLFSVRHTFYNVRTQCQTNSQSKLRESLALAHTNYSTYIPSQSTARASAAQQAPGRNDNRTSGHRSIV